MIDFRFVEFKLTDHVPVNIFCGKKLIVIRTYTAKITSNVKN